MILASPFQPFGLCSPLRWGACALLIAGLAAVVQLAPHGAAPAVQRHAASAQSAGMHGNAFDARVNVRPNADLPAYRAAVLPASLAWQLRSSDDLQDYIERARFDPASGGFYYALKAYDFCTREAKVGGRLARPEDLLNPEEPFPDLRRLKAAARIAELCRGFDEPRAPPISYISLTEEGRSLSDPKLMLAHRLEKLSTETTESVEFADAGARAALLSAVLATRDPWLIRDLAAELRLIGKRVRILIDGEAINADDYESFFAALDFAACDLGAPCGADDDWNQLLACSQAARCDTLQGGGFRTASAPGQRDASRDLQQKIRRLALDAGTDWLDFVPHPAP